MLQGIRIIEMEGLGPAPFAGMWLADQGAEVIVIQRPAPASPVAQGVTPVERGKRAIVLDLKAPDDLAVARALIDSADALIEGFRPGVMERLGLGPEQFAQSNPGLVYGRVTGWGQSGPRAATAGHDLNYLAVSGALWYAGAPGTPPVPPPTLLGDVGGGALHLLAGILAALLRAARTGRGAVVDAAIVDGAANMMALLMSMAPSGNLVPERGESLLDGPPWSRCYSCADGRWLSVQCLEPKFHAAFLARLGLSDDPALAAQHDRALWPEQTATLARIFAAEPQAHWARLFDGTDACVAPVLSPWEAAQEAHMVARGAWDASSGVLQPAPAPCFDGRRAGIAAAPARGADGEAIRRELSEGSVRDRTALASRDRRL